MAIIDILHKGVHNDVLDCLRLTGIMLTFISNDH